ncbi:MAG TPA: hypothetical protein VGK17_03500 [Propionicimonas sp.]
MRAAPTTAMGQAATRVALDRCDASPIVGSLTTRRGNAIDRIEATALADLCARGVVIPDPEQAGAYLVSPDHRFDEVDPDASLVWRQAGFDPRPALRSMLSSHRDGQR